MKLYSETLQNELVNLSKIYTPLKPQLRDLSSLKGHLNPKLSDMADKFNTYEYVRVQDELIENIIAKIDHQK